MHRGTYGIEFDDDDGFSFRKLAWLFLLLPVVAIAVFVFRGCTQETSPAKIAGNDSLKEEPYDPSGLPSPRGERTPFFKGFSGRAKVENPEKSPVVSRPPVAEPAPLPAPEPELVQKAEAPVGLPDAVQKRLEDAAAKETKDDLLAAREVLLALLSEKDAATVQDFIERKLAVLNQKLLFGDRPMPGKIIHKVAAGDLIGKIARMHDTTQDFISKVNGVKNAANLRIGQELWVLDKPKFCLTVYKKHCSAVLTLNGNFFKRYTIGVGPSADVPVGSYAISNRVKHPVYRRAKQRTIPYGAPGNILGTTWLGLAPTRNTPVVTGFALHGTWVNASLGRACEEGRVRFSNTDIEQLALLLPVGTRVQVVE